MVDSCVNGGKMSVKDSVLEALQQNKEIFLSGEKLSEGLGVSRAAIWKAIKGLREDGYRIDAVTNRGYRLIENTGQITEDGIRSFLPSAYKSNEIFIYDTTDSTNIRAREIVAGRNIHGAIVVARQQTEGRGRLGRGFFSPGDGVYLSIIIRPDFDIFKSTLVTVAAASAVSEAIDAVCGQEDETQIKWVNDVYLTGKKICGILTEGITNFENGQIEHMITGIGINTSIDAFPDELKKTAGAVEGEWDRSHLIAEIVNRFLEYVENIDKREFMKTYRDKSMLIGKNVLVYKGTYRKDPGDELEGTPAKVTGISSDGGLVIINQDGSEEILTTGEVSIRVDQNR